MEHKRATRIPYQGIKASDQGRMEENACEHAPKQAEAYHPCFWKEYKKHITNFTKSNLMKNATAGDTWKANLGLFLNMVVDISDG